MARVGHSNVFRRRLAVDRTLERRAEKEKSSPDDGKEEDEKDPKASEPWQSELQTFIDGCMPDFFLVRGGFRCVVLRHDAPGVGGKMSFWGGSSAPKSPDVFSFIENKVQRKAGKIK